MIDDRARRASRIKRAIQSSYVRSITVRITGAALAFLAFNWVLRQADASRVAPFSFVIPLTAFTLGIQVRDEPFVPELAVALALVVLGLYGVTAGAVKPGTTPKK